MKDNFHVVGTDTWDLRDVVLEKDNENTADETFEQRESFKWDGHKRTQIQTSYTGFVKINVRTEKGTMEIIFSLRYEKKEVMAGHKHPYPNGKLYIQETSLQCRYHELIGCVI